MNANLLLLLRGLSLSASLLLAVLSSNLLQAQACTASTTNPTAYGNGSWIGHVYDHNGSGNPVTSPFNTYRGYTTESEIFNRDWGNSNPACAAGSNNFAVRYRMNKTFPAGNYTFTIGGDDGVRLSIDGGVTWIVSDWGDHGYRTVSVRVPMSGNYNLVLEYYEKTGGARVSFSYTSSASTNFSMPDSNITGMITTCSGVLYDSGGSGGNYANSENRTVIIKPATAGSLVQINGSLTTEGGWDYLTVYDGEGTGGTILWGGEPHGLGGSCQTFTVPTIISNTGSLTVRFYSDGSNQCAGFNLNINCAVPISISSSAALPLCKGNATTLTASSSAAYTYTWSPATGLNTTTGATVTSTPTSTTTYTVTGTLGTVVLTKQITVTVNQVVPKLYVVQQTVSPSGAQACEQNYVKLDVGGMPPATAFDEKVTPLSYGWTKYGPSTGGSPPVFRGIDMGGSASNNAGGTSSEWMFFYKEDGYYQDWYLYPNDGNITNYLPISLDGYAGAVLNFKSRFISRGNGFARNIYVDVSADGATWTPIWSRLNIVNNADILESITGIDLSAYLGGNLYIRFRYTGQSNGLQNWYLDDINITGTVPTVSWSPSAGLYTDSSLSVPYLGGNSTTLYAAPDGTVNYNLSTSIGSCSRNVPFSVTHTNNKFIGTTTNWNVATNWIPGSVPDANRCVVIPNTKTAIIGAGTNAFAKNIKVQSGGKLEIAGNLTVTDFIKNETGNPDNFVVKSDGNLIQINPVTNTDLISAERDVTDMDNVLATQMDYVYWSAPVTGQKLRGTAGEGGFSPGTPNNRFFEYNESNDYFVSTPDATFAPGKGYAIRAEDGYSNGYDKTYVFRGVPNNGEVSINIRRSADVGTVQHGFNLVGNPYPSNIDFTKLYANNSGLIFNTAYFWTNTTYTQYQQGSSYAGNNYAVFSGTGGNPPTGSSYQTAPNGIVKVGQSFMIQKRNVSGPEPLVFKNSYGAGQDLRVTTAGTFYQKGAGDRDRFWVQLVSPANVTNTQLIGYVEGASSGFEQDYDVEIMELSSDIFYSKADDKQLLIQGKGLFNVADKVALGASFFSAGNYTIRLDHAEGVFASGQPIYLKDKATGVITDLSQGSYTFAAGKGVSDGRFEIIYTPETILSTDGSAKDDLVVYRDRDDFVIKSRGMKMTGLEVYDGAGRLIFSSKPNQTETRIPGTALGNGMYLLKVNRNNTMTAKKILK